MKPAQLARAQRRHVADLLDHVGPDAPTLCEGWTTRDLAAHLVVRDRRPDALPGIGMERLAAHTKKVQDAQAARPFPETVDLVRSGPPRYAPTRVPAVDGRVNLAEYVIHGEDIRRAQPAGSVAALPTGPDPRELDDAVWGLLVMAPLLLRRSPVRVVARSDGRDDITLARGRKAKGRTKGTNGSTVGEVVLVGRPVDLLLLCTGRASASTAQVVGDDAARAAFERLALGL